MFESVAYVLATETVALASVGRRMACWQDRRRDMVSVAELEDGSSDLGAGGNGRLVARARSAVLFRAAEPDQLAVTTGQPMVAPEMGK